VTPPDPQALIDEAAELRSRARYAEAEAIYRHLIDIHPEAPGPRYLLGTLLLLQGRFAEGLPLYEHRFETFGLTFPPIGFPRWTGEDLTGKGLLIWWDQGFGDQIQMARFAPLLARTARRVTMIVEPALKRLFDSLQGVEVFARAGKVEFPDPDYWIPALSIPNALKLTAKTIPAEPYLAAPQASAPAGAKIGVMARGDARNVNDANRSLPADQAARLLALPGALSLHPEDSKAGDFADTAALIAGLDLVISVDTAVAHLAGAMGKPVWLLIPAQGTDWRWMAGRDDSPWYPSMRIFRQKPGAGWAPVVDEVLRGLAP
jgi:hypothetical protein